jgi:hypothetical protein
MITASARRAAGRPRTAWAVTLLATAASTYALDTFAVAVGALLAGSGVSAALDRPTSLAFLGATYLVWAAGLRVSLAANWRLLGRTRTSMSALSKAAYELAEKCDASQRTRRLAASGGYIAMEAAKEVPYYLSAFGAAVLSTAVSTNQAIVFLAGTNVGAAIYECGLARATHGFLRHRSRRVRP